ncbi:RPA-interacting protein [Malurus melanocephalus]|uniref:RPA-interacting protein n=1 Tax=Malurus melanocephalus TaxID=175006 RepID=UPI002548A540|nr:RPA-interacting protein [Malurus melanocephalus]
MVLGGAQQRLVHLEKGRVYAQKAHLVPAERGGVGGAEAAQADGEQGGGGPVPEQQRCMERLRSSRAKLLDRYRQAGDGACGAAPGALLVQEVMEQEWQELRDSLPGHRGGEPMEQMLEDPDELAVLEEIQQELILQEQSVIEEYERSLRFDEECLNAMLEGLDASDRVICPVCRKNNLTVKAHLVCCQCGLYISTQDMTEGKLRSLLESTLTEHSQRCLHSPEFTVTSGMEEETSLLMSCPVCDSWTIIL